MTHSPDYLAGRAEALEEAEKAANEYASRCGLSHQSERRKAAWDVATAIRALKETPR